MSSHRLDAPLLASGHTDTNTMSMLSVFLGLIRGDLPPRNSNELN